MSNISQLAQTIKEIKEHNITTEDLELLKQFNSIQQQADLTETQTKIMQEQSKYQIKLIKTKTDNIDTEIAMSRISNLSTLFK